ncbi:MAG: ABC transporter ATP-binding protein [Solirubrobacteraceae bacterium]|nr:ABC transporter ATP-binding protein [Solirubrobacteraceae bacterium]
MRGEHESADNGVVLGASSVTKRFPGVVANDRVDFALRRGEVHALLGENGSGKTTLCKILTGLYRPDEGSVIIDDAQTGLHSPADAHANGIFMVHQHFSLVDNMTVAENVVLGWKAGRRMRLSRAEIEDEVAAAAERFDMFVHPRAQIWQLSVGERQRVEILKTLYRGAHTLILDEPTTVLTPQEAERLFESLRRMAEHGGSVVFISHKLPEVLSVCDRVTVLRQGRNVGTVDIGDGATDAKGLARMMVGREIELGRRPERRGRVGDEPLLRLVDVSADGDHGAPAVKDVSLAVLPGEVLGIAGVAGNGQRELAEVVTGVRPRSAGTVALDGRELANGSPLNAAKRGIAYVPEDRMGVGLAPGMELWENLLLRAGKGACWRGPFIRRSNGIAHAERLVESFDIRGQPRTLVRQLSGGNAQKVLLARELSSDPRVLVIAAPTRGLDVAAMAAVRAFLIEAAEHGVAVMLISEDLEELMDLCDRIAVMCAGRVTGVVSVGSTDVEEIGLLMGGVAA